MIRIKKKQNSKYAYALDRGDTWKVKTIGIAGLISLAFLIVGFTSFLLLSKWVTLFITPLLVMISAYHAVQYGLMVKYPGFDVAIHNRKVTFFRNLRDKPKVAVLIPAAGEDNAVVAMTIKAALKIDYPLFRVFLLDDSKTGQYQELSRQLGCAYVRRLNTGEHKKAGNLNHAVARLKRADYFLVLDADFVPRPEIINELIPYAGDDVGIVQSPQHFPLTKEVYKRSKIEYGAAYIQRDFYRITQVARDRFGSAICVGTNALYSRIALSKVGGYEGVGRKDWGHSEDVNTGLKMINTCNDSRQRYKIKYIPIQLAAGTCPDKHHSFYKQQNRWCTGSMQLMLSKKTLFSKQLSIMQKVCYASNSLYYFYTIGLLTMPLYLMTIIFTGYAAEWQYTLLFIPMIITNYVLGPVLLRKEIKPLAVSLVVISNAYTFVHALYLLAIRKPLGWEATGSSPKSRSHHFTQFKIISSLCFVLFYVVTLGAVAFNESYSLSSTVLIVGLFAGSFAAHSSFLLYTLLNGMDFKQAFKDRKTYASVALIVIVSSVLIGSLKFGQQYDVTMNDNMNVSLIREVKP